jgi:cell division protein FtsW
MLGFTSGGLWGNGAGKDKQQLVHLPEAHLDFLLPILGEEFGSVAAMFVLALYITFSGTCIMHAMNIKPRDPLDISCGIGLSVAPQIIISPPVLIVQRPVSAIT